MDIKGAVEKLIEEKNKDKKDEKDKMKMSDSQKNKAREMERALENFQTAAHHFAELGRDIDISDIKDDIKDEVNSALR